MLQCRERERERKHPGRPDHVHRAGEEQRVWERPAEPGRQAGRGRLPVAVVLTLLRRVGLGLRAAMRGVRQLVLV